ncbi:hypothetical protein Pcac1_g1695 [Phytophthora cactorum]|nr:hypothetical protein Pcac1_g1695 [Phytophthora cactorum]
MPLSIWILASFQYGMNQESYRYAANLSSNIQLHGNQQNLNGFWLRISVTITSRDGFERAAVFPQVIAFKHCTFQSVIDAILFQKNWCGYGNDTSSNVITMCQCQALIAERNAAGEIKTVAMQDEPKTLQQDQLATSLGSILPFNCASEALQCTIDHRKIAFELLFSVVEVDEQSSLANVLARLPAEFSSQRYVIGHPAGFTVQNLLIADRVEDQFEDKTPASALPKPMHAYELLDITGGGDDTVAPITGSSQLYLRFVHRYSDKPKSSSNRHYAPTFVLHRQECSPHTKQLSLWSLPPILVLQLKRFELSITTGNYQWKKLSHNVDFPVYGLDLHDLLASIDGAHNDSEVCSDRCSVDALDPRVCRGIEYLQNELNIPLTSASRTCAKYDLYAVVHHSGHGIGSGHYTAQFRRPDENYWWNADDAVVTPLNEDDISPSSAAYLLFYVRQDVAAGVTGLSDLFPPQM